MGLMWFVEGMLVVLAFNGMLALSKRYPMDWKAWVGMITGCLLVLFCIAWSVASFAEGEPQSGAMGIVFFGLGGLVVCVLTWRFFIRPVMDRAAAKG